MHFFIKTRLFVLFGTGHSAARSDPVMLGLDDPLMSFHVHRHGQQLRLGPGQADDERLLCIDPDTDAVI
ncbi:MAG: hypothetical protein WAU70_13870 [Flavobacteriales bacterium]